MSNNKDIQKVLEEIQREIDESGATYEERIKFEMSNLQHMEANSNFQDMPNTTLNYYNPFWTGKGIKGKVFGIVKKAIRKMNFFLAIPILEQQSEYNAWVQKEILNLHNIIEEQKEVIKKLQDGNDAKGEM